MSPEDGWDPESVREFEDFDRVPQYDGPQESAAVPGDWPFALEDEISNLTGKASVASHIRELIRTLIGADPFEPLIMLVSGDWHMLLLQAMAFEDTGIAFEKIADNVNRGRFGFLAVSRGFGLGVGS